MNKPNTIAGYSDQFTKDCERVLVTLLIGIGRHRDSFYLIGGLTPRYLVPQRPPAVPAHAGTLDVDMVIDLQVLANAESYQSLEENFAKLGFTPAANQKGNAQRWRWAVRTEHGAIMVIELLSDRTQGSGALQPLAGEGRISALNMDHVSIVFDHYETVDVSAELLGNGGVGTVSVKYANLVGFTCLKAFAIQNRIENKDAHDLVYCLEHTPDKSEAVAEKFREAKKGRHGDLVRRSLDILKTNFLTDRAAEGYLKRGPVSVAAFELGTDVDPARRELRILRQRQASAVVDRLIKDIG